MKVTPASPVYSVGDPPPKTPEEREALRKELQERRAALAYKRKIKPLKGYKIDEWV